MVQIKRAIADVDVGGLWEFHLPRVAATQESLRSVEDALGFDLDPQHRQFLTYADGWPSFLQSVDLFGTDDLGGGPRMQIACELLAGLEPAVLQQSGVQDKALLPIAATTVDLDMFVMQVVGGKLAPPIIWFAGYEIDRFATFEEYVHAMIEYNLRELSDFKDG